MNNPSPLVPQGVTPRQAKSSLCFKVLMIVMVHIVVIGGMLLQGCKDTSSKDQSKQDNTGAMPSDTTPAVATTPAPAGSPTDVPSTLNANISNSIASGVSATPVPDSAPVTGVVPPAHPTDLSAPAAPTETKEYVIAKGDTLAVIAHKNGLSLKALMEANQGVNAKKLQIGQKLQIPAGTAAVTAASATSAPTDAASSDSSVYVVKSGDMLLRIAKAHGTTVKKIMAMNDLKTTSIRAGQKLKLPASNAAPSAPTTGPAGGAVPSATASVTRVSGATSPVAAN